MITYTFEAIGTVWTIDIPYIVRDEKKQALLKKVSDRIELFDKTYSRFRDDSVITKMSQKAGTYTLPDDAASLISLYKKLYTITDGTVTPLIGDVLTNAGYDATYSLKEAATLHHPDAWDDVIEYSPPNLSMKKPAILDFGAAGKGYLVDIIGKLIEDEEFENFSIDASGDIFYKDSKKEPLRIGLEHPDDPKKAIGIATITSGSLCGSAINRRKWGKFHHIINPHTLSSPTEILSIWVTAKTAIVADALTTCLFFTPSNVLKKHFDFEYVLLKKDFTIERSHDFPGEFFYNEK